MRWYVGPYVGQNLKRFVRQGGGGEGGGDGYVRIESIAANVAAVLSGLHDT